MDASLDRSFFDAQDLSDLAQRQFGDLLEHERQPELQRESRHALLNDLVGMVEGVPGLAAPAHDVLENWAIIHWLDRRFSLSDGEAENLEKEIGASPAVRHGYRKWLSEKLEAGVAGPYVLESFEAYSLPEYLQDDTLVCALFSSSWTITLESVGEVLFGKFVPPLLIELGRSAWVALCGERARAGWAL